MQEKFGIRKTIMKPVVAKELDEAIQSVLD